ncbi:MAG TPA: hypothetical protein VGF38_05545 [Ktedonobacterales bacterium]
MDIDPALRLYPGQEALTPAQETEAQRFAAERIAAQLSTEPVDEPAADALLVQSYTVAQLPPPARILWVDGPMQLVQLVVPSASLFVADHVKDDVEESVVGGVIERVRASMWWGDRGPKGWEFERDTRSAEEKSMVGDIWRSVARHVGHVESLVRQHVWTSVKGVPWHSESSWASVHAYYHANYLAVYRFFDEYLEPNDLHAFAHFNELVSGYWLGRQRAIIVRRPRVLARDAAGRLHSATGKCVEYRDGWGLYAWHGTQATEKSIMAPETLTREDFLNAPNFEMERFIQERMGDRFMAELGGQVIDAGPAGVLYEVVLGEREPKRVARYVQLQDASTARQYFLYVPSTIQTAAEAAAWSFWLYGEAYRPMQET